MKEFKERIELIQNLSGVKLSAYDKFNLLMYLNYNFKKGGYVLWK